MIWPHTPQWSRVYCFPINPDSYKHLLINVEQYDIQLPYNLSHFICRHIVLPSTYRWCGEITKPVNSDTVKCFVTLFFFSRRSFLYRANLLCLCMDSWTLCAVRCQCCYRPQKNLCGFRLKRSGEKRLFKRSPRRVGCWLSFSIHVMVLLTKCWSQIYTLYPSHRHIT